jgi:putative Holliday junction resolvase
MGRILAIDYGRKRSGIAVTDPSRIIATGLTALSSDKLLLFLGEYFAKEPVDVIVIGEPKTLLNNKSENAKYVDPFVTRLKKAFPEKELVRYDERFTSVIAKQTMLAGGLKKSDRRKKGTADLISAIIILQDYLEWSKHRS